MRQISEAGQAGWPRGKGDAKKVENALNKLDKLHGLTTKEPSTPADQQKGYATPSRRDMDRLFESRQ